MGTRLARSEEATKVMAQNNAKRKAVVWRNVVGSTAPEKGDEKRLKTAGQ